MFARCSLLFGHRRKSYQLGYGLGGYQFNSQSQKQQKNQNRANPLDENNHTQDAQPSTVVFPPEKFQRDCAEAIEKFLPPHRTSFTPDELVTWMRRLNRNFHPSQYGAVELRELLRSCRYLLKSRGMYNIQRDGQDPRRIVQDTWNYVESGNSSFSRQHGFPQGPMEHRWLR
eukprot:PhF_6_TR36783/c0_g1_i1/m.54112